MIENKNKRRGFKVASILCAFLIWLWVVNVADPVITNTVEIPVEIENEEILLNNGMTYEVVGKRTATISYDVNATNAYRIKHTDFRAYADMSEMWSVTGAVPIKVEVLNNKNYLMSTPVSKTTAIKVETEPMQTKRFDLNTILEGKLMDGYKIGNIKLSPSHIYLKGPESKIGQISSAGIEVSISDLNSKISGIVYPIFYDANGNRIDLNNKIEKSDDKVNYEIEVLKAKNLLLDFDVSGDVAEGYRFTGIKCDIKTIPVVGIESDINSIGTLTIPNNILKLNGESTNVVKTVNISKLLPVGITLDDSERNEINVTMLVERIEEKTYSVKLDYNSFVGKNEEYIYKAETDAVNIQIKALKKDLDSLNLNANDFEIDVTGLTEGIHKVSVKLIKELDKSYEVIHVGDCDINVMKVSEGPSLDSPTEINEIVKNEGE